MIKISLQFVILALLLSTSQATFKKRKGNKKGEDTAAQGSSHGSKPAQPEGPPHSAGSGEYQNSGGYPSDAPPHGYRGAHPHGEGHRGGPQPNGYHQGGEDDYDGYRREPSHHHHHHHNREPEGEGYRGPSRAPHGGYRGEHDSYRGEPSNHGINYNRGEPYRHFQNMHAGPGPQHQHIPNYGNGGPRTNYRGGPHDDDDKRRYGPGGTEYENSDEEDDRQGLGWVGIHGTTSSDGSTKANQTEGTGTGRLGSFFSRTRSGIKRLLKLS